jgi:hypothetical protein
MPEDLEILWIDLLVMVQPVSERAADWLYETLPAKARWAIRYVSHNEIVELAAAARQQGLTMGGIHMPVEEIV